MRPTRSVIAPLALLFGLSADALAHGERGHSRSESAPVVKEQTAWGIAGDPEAATRHIEVVMTDTMRFVPDHLTVREGETVRLSVTNAGALMHELVIGDEASLREHAEWMLKFPEMEHDEPYMAHVAPGETVDLTWTFNRAGEFRFACLIPGHYQAGMIGDVAVTAAPASTIADRASSGTGHRHAH